MLLQSVALLCQARKFSSFSTSLYIRFCSSQFCKAFGVLNHRYICSVPHAARRGFFVSLSSHKLRDLSTGRCHRKERFTKDETANISSFSSVVSDEEYSNTSRVKFRSAENTLDEDGFMNIKDLVDFLKRESAMDICVIKTSGDRRTYVEYFVIVSGVSTRHLRAMAKNLEQLFRGHEVRGIGRHGHVVVEGLESDHWIALDIGNIVVHFFLPEVREVYELEKLWTLGPKYDDQSQAMLERERFLRAAELGTKLDDELN